MSTYSLTLFTQPISFESDEPIFFPTIWERVSIPDEILVAVFDWYFADSKEYRQAQDNLTSTRQQWLKQFAKKGFTAIKFTASDDTIIAEATKQTWMEGR